MNLPVRPKSHAIYFTFLFYLLFFYPVYCISNPVHPESLDFIYINSSVDESAGGHAAVRLDNTVFHYQYHDNGLFLLVKESWPEFLYSYNNLQNRTLSVVDIPVSHETFQKIKMRFLMRYLLQEKRLFYLEQFKRESVFFDNISSQNSTVAITGLGLFSCEKRSDYAALLLRKSIEDEFGNTYIANIQNDVNQKLKRMIAELHPTLLTYSNLTSIRYKK